MDYLKVADLLSSDGASEKQNVSWKTSQNLEPFATQTDKMYQMDSVTVV